MLKDKVRRDGVLSSVAVSVTEATDAAAAQAQKAK